MWSRRQKIAFVTFAVASFARPALLIAIFFGLARPVLSVSFNFPISPQAMVFMHPAQFRAIYICLKHEFGVSECLSRNQFSAERIREPYFLGQTAFNHGIESLVAFPGEAYTRQAVTRVSDYACRGGVRAWALSRELESEEALPWHDCP